MKYLFTPTPFVRPPPFLCRMKLKTSKDMRYDKDLHFLAECGKEDLKTLADHLTHDAKGEIRMSEQLTNTLAYVRNYPDNMHELWREITGELQRYGGNTIVNCFRQQGVCYHVILKDICKKMHVPYQNRFDFNYIVCKIVKPF